MRRGDVVVAAAAGDYGKPRPYVVIQADALSDVVESVILCPLSSWTGVGAFRVALSPGLSNGLRLPSEMMTDKLVSLSRAKIGARIGALAANDLEKLDQALVLVLGLTDGPPRG